MSNDENMINVNITTVTKSNSGHIYVDVERSILNLEIINEKYNHDEFLVLCNALKQFLKQACDNKLKYFLIFHTQKIGIYPLRCYEIIKKTLEEIKPQLTKVLHSTCVLVEPNFTSQILKFFFAIYKPVRPAIVITKLTEAEPFFEKNINTAEF